MRVSGCHFVITCLVVALVAWSGCSAESADEAGHGTVELALTTQVASGAVYRLRDATISIDGPMSRTWHTEDDPELTSLSANVLVGNYRALLADGWRLERVDGSMVTTVDAELVSDNPVLFTVATAQRTAVPLQFRVDADPVDMTQGYDIVLGVQESPLFLAITSTAPASVSVYSTQANGNVAPFRRISGSSTGLVGPIGVVVSGNQLITSDNQGSSSSGINFYPVTADGNVAPIRRISGSATQLSNPFGLAVSRGELYVGQFPGPILVFPLTASGNVAPTRTITGLSSPAWIAIDKDELYVADTNSSRVKVFPITASGAATPSRTITPSDAICMTGIVVRTGEVLVADDCVSQIHVYPAAANGTVAPLRVLGTGASGPHAEQGLARFGSELYLVMTQNHVSVFPSAASGSVSPIRTIAGANTLFGTVQGVTVF